MAFPLPFPWEFLLFGIIADIRLHPFALQQTVQFSDGILLHCFVDEPHFLEVGFGVADCLFIEPPQAQQLAADLIIRVVTQQKATAPCGRPQEAVAF